MSQGRKCLRAGLVSWLAVGDVQGQNRLAAGNVQKFRAGSVLLPDLVLGRTSLGASELLVVAMWFLIKWCAYRTSFGQSPFKN